MKDCDFQKLKIEQVESTRLWTYCVFHNDTTRPNLSISLTEPYVGCYKCWACNRKGRLTNKQIIELGISQFPTYTCNSKKLSLRWDSYISDCVINLKRFPLLEIALATQLNVSIKSIKDWEIGYDGQAYIISMYNYQNGVCGAQRRFLDGIKKSVYGSNLGYMFPWNFGLDEGCLFICEGFSDAISVWDLGFESIARPNCHFIEGINGLLAELEYDYDNAKIIIVPDNDEVGKAGAIKLHNELKWDYTCSIFEFKEVKDIRKLIQVHGKDCVKQLLRRATW